MLRRRRPVALRGIWVVCADEIPNHQVLERIPIRRAIPGSIEHQELTISGMAQSTS